MTRAILALLFLPLPTIAAPARKAKETDLYFPTKVGDTLVYEVKAGDATNEFTEVVTKVEPLGDAVLVSLSRRVGTEDRLKEKVAVASNGLARRWFAQRELDPPHPLLKLTPGGTWTVEGAAAKNPRKSAYAEGKAEEISVPAGKYQAIPVEETLSTAVKGSSITHWYAPRVGLIKSVARVGDSGPSVTTTLKSFTPGK